MDPRQLVLNLERPFSEFSRKIACVEDVLLAGLRWRSDYWTGLAIEWINQGADITGLIVAELEVVATDLSLKQSIRHSAFAIAKQQNTKIAQAEHVVGGNGG